MEFKLPEVFDIYTKVAGRRIKGAYAFILGRLIVYYKGDAEIVPKPVGKEDAPEIAKQVLQRLVKKRNAESGSVPEDLPAAIRPAAKRYLDRFDDEKAIQ